MPKATKTVTDAKLRADIFRLLDLENNPTFQKINDRQYGCLLTDCNGDKRYIRLGAIVAELREDMTAEELMRSEMDAYELKQTEKAIKAEEKKQKIARDQARREKEKAEKEKEG